MFEKKLVMSLSEYENFWYHINVVPKGGTA